MSRATEWRRLGDFSACLKNSSRRREEAEKGAILGPKSASSRRRLPGPHSCQPAIEIGLNKVIVI